MSSKVVFCITSESVCMWERVNSIILYFRDQEVYQAFQVEMDFQGGMALVREVPWAHLVPQEMRPSLLDPLGPQDQPVVQVSEEAQAISFLDSHPVFLL